MYIISGRLSLKREENEKDNRENKEYTRKDNSWNQVDFVVQSGTVGLVVVLGCRHLVDGLKWFLFENYVVFDFFSSKLERRENLSKYL